VLTLRTDVPELVLRAHVPDDAVALHDLLQQNAVHLRERGDYDDEIAMTADDWRSEFASYERDVGAPHSFGMWLDGVGMVGRIVLVPAAPPSYGVGYWVAETQQNKGIATYSLTAVIGYARRLGATEVFAGVLHGNDASRRVLQKCGFVEVADLDVHTRFRCAISPEM
jgi:RimJ/RimL family protein N-acetyltransferase